MEQLKQGYKQTDIGVIPEDWEVESVRRLGKFSKGKGISRTESQTGDIPSIRYGEIYTTHNNYIKKFNSFISEAVAKKSQKLKTGDLLFTASGETKEDIGKCVAFIDNIEAYAGGDIIILSPENQYNSLLLGFLLNAPCVVKQKANKGQGDAVVHITKDALSEIILALPKETSEQDAIANALSDINALIAELGKKITKKQHIKQGAMQQLLCGKKRLSGFSGEWGEKTIGQTLTIKHGKNQKNIEIPSGSYPILGTGGVMGYTDIPLYSKESVLIGRKGTIDKPYFYDTPFWTVDTLFYSEIKDGYSAKFIYYKFNQIDWYAYNEASGVPSLNAKVIESIIIAFPPTFVEQSAIAQILTDMDNEIEKLQAKREKYIEIKMGMMQQLLTGKIRLI